MDVAEKLKRLALPVKPGRNPNTHVGLTDAIGLPSDLSKEDCANAINDLAEVRHLVTEMRTAHDDVGKGLGDEPWIRYYTAFKNLEEKLGLRETDAKRS